MTDKLLLNIIKQLNNFFEITAENRFALKASVGKANDESVGSLHKVNNKYCLNTPPL